MKAIQVICVVLAVISFFYAGVMFTVGLDKISNYYNSDTNPSLNTNAYVGGDAYNYIINAEYATGYFVRALMGVVIGFGLIVVSFLSRIVPLLEHLITLERVKPSGDENFKNSNLYTGLPNL